MSLRKLSTALCSRERLVFFIETAEFEAAFFGVKLETLAFLRFESLGRGFSCGGAKPLAVLAPFDEEATARRPLDTSLGIALEGDVAPALGCLDPPQDVDSRHSVLTRNTTA